MKFLQLSTTTILLLFILFCSFILFSNASEEEQQKPLTAEQLASINKLMRQHYLKQKNVPRTVHEEKVKEAAKIQAELLKKLEFKHQAAAEKQKETAERIQKLMNPNNHQKDEL